MARKAIFIIPGKGMWDDFDANFDIELQESLDLDVNEDETRCKIENLSGEPVA